MTKVINAAVAHSREQEKKFHAMLRDVSRQLKWAGVEWDEASWKVLILAAKYGQTVGPNPFAHGLLIMNNRRSSKLYKHEYADLITELQAFGDEQGVRWSDPTLPPIEAYEEARCVNPGP